MPGISLRGVHKTYPGGVHAVRDLNLEIGSGEFIALVGPSGCGKSTTLRMIAGLESISSGEIAIDGRVVNNVHPKDRDIAMVFQNYALYPHMTVEKNMSFALRLRKVPRDEIRRRVRDVAESLGLTPYLSRKPRALSGGQRQRVALGRAIVRDPKAFLFDEPLSNLDAKLRVETRGELKALHQRLRTTTVYVTHDQEEAMTLGDRIVVMAEAEVQQVDTPLNVYNRPANRFVAAFIGTPPMAFFDGRFEEGASGLEFVSDLPAGDGPAVRLRVHESHLDLVRDHAGAVVMGLRPTSLSEVLDPDRAQAEGDAGSLIRPAVRVVEPLGDRMDLHLGFGEAESFLARVTARQGVEVGAEAAFSVATDELHYFEPGPFGRSLLSPEPAASPVAALAS